MALVTKNDVTQIFAIQAPSIDLPPTFANYPRGWDTARANNGKPTIKQFNYIQQRTDQNILYIHQNGAALPHDAAMEYAEGATVVKDGLLQQWKGGAWVKALEWSSIDNKPTTVAGYGITNTYTKTEADTLFIDSTQIGQPNGVAELDANGDLDPSLLPIATDTSAGIVQLNNTLISTATNTALTAAQGKVLQDTKLAISNAFGVGQNWQDVKASRALSVNYTNTSGKLIKESVSVVSSGVGLITLVGRIDELDITPNSIQANGLGAYLTCSIEVPNGKSYSFVLYGNATVQDWNKLS